MKFHIIINRCAYFIFLLTAAIGCNDQGGNLPKVDTGANARVLFNYPDNSYLNLTDLSKAVMAFDVYSVNTNLDRIEYMATYTKFSTGATSANKLAFTIQGSEFKSGKVEKKQMTAAELATLFAVPGGFAGLSGGDSFTFVQKAFLKDGRTFDLTNSAPSITTGASASFTTKFTVFVGCASDQTKIVGNYTATMLYDDSGAFTPGSTSDVVITFKGPEPFRYNISEITVLGYVQYGGQAAGYPGDFFDICGVPILLSTGTQFGTIVNYTGGTVPPFSVAAIDKSTAQTTITINWWETNNDIKASIQLVKKP